MKPILRRGLGLLVFLLFAAIWLISAGMSDRQRRTRTCQGKGTLDVVVTDSLERQFVSRADVEKWLEEEYRAYAGMPLDSVDLGRIEQIVGAHSAVRDAQAWLTDDGILHVQLSQRQPVVRFQDGKNAFYADKSGFVFPMQDKGNARVPVVDGELPFHLPQGYKGCPEDPAHLRWLLQIIGLTEQMKGTIWEKDISGIRVDGKQDLVLIPREGRERFLFGPPVRVEEKFALMEAYYRSVAPSKEAGYYALVDLRYRGQLVCRKK